MKTFISLLCILFCHGWAAAQPMSCHTPARVAPIIAPTNPDPLNGDYCVTEYVEVDHDVVLDKGIDGARIYTEGLLSQVATLYAAQGISLNWIVKYWDTPSPYSGTNSQQLLYQFRDHLNGQGGHPGDVAHLLSYQASGGVAFVDVMCSEGFGYAFSSIRPTYEPYPAYSWSVMVVAHELGHNLGSPHTHSCSWPGGAIDSCSPGGTEGNCDSPGVPAEGGTVMSYCNLTTAGINLTRGFHPLPLALIKNRIAAGPCTDCDVPDGPDEPEPPACDANQLIMEVQLDNYPAETQWALLDDELNIVAQAGPWAKNQMNTYHADTLCVPDGCYSLVVTDPDGLTGYGCGEGLYLLNGPSVELASGQAWTGQDVTHFCLNTAPPEPQVCTEAGPNADRLESYANQDQWGGVSVSGENLVKISGNSWKAEPGVYTITPGTELRGSFQAPQLGEIHAVSFMNTINAINPAQTVRFAGTQAWGIANDEQLTGTGWEELTIPIGQFIPPGEYNYLVLINDQDAPGQTAVTGWKNLELCESGATNLKRARPQVQGSVEDEAVLEGLMVRPYPNPTFDTLNIPPGPYQLYSGVGKIIREGDSNSIDLSLLPAGIYFLAYAGRIETIIKY